MYSEGSTRLHEGYQIKAEVTRGFTDAGHCSGRRDTALPCLVGITLNRVSELGAHTTKQTTHMAKFGPQHFVAPAAAFTMAIVVAIYVKGTMRRAKWEAEYERQLQENARRSRPEEPATRPGR